jgi:hypothetical protein
MKEKIFRWRKVNVSRSGSSPTDDLMREATRFWPKNQSSVAATDEVQLIIPLRQPL